MNQSPFAGDPPKKYPHGFNGFFGNGAFAESPHGSVGYCWAEVIGYQENRGRMLCDACLKIPIPPSDSP